MVMPKLNKISSTLKSSKSAEGISISPGVCGTLGPLGPIGPVGIVIEGGPTPGTEGGVVIVGLKGGNIAGGGGATIGGVMPGKVDRSVGDTSKGFLYVSEMCRINTRHGRYTNQNIICL